MPAPAPIRFSYQNPAALAGLALAAGGAQYAQREQDRRDRSYQQELSMVMAGLQDRARLAALDAEIAAKQAAQSRAEQAARAAAGGRAGGVATFDRYGQLSAAGVPAGATRLMDAARAASQRAASAQRQVSAPLGKAQAAEAAPTFKIVTGPDGQPLPMAIPGSRPATVQDPLAPRRGFGAIRGPEITTATAGGNMFVTGRDGGAAEYQNLMRDAGRETDPQMLEALRKVSQGPGGAGGGFVRAGGGQVPAQVGAGLSILAPYQDMVLPSDFQMLEQAVRSGSMTDTNKLIDQMEDAFDRKMEATKPAGSGAAERIREHEIKMRMSAIERLERARDLAIMNDVYDNIQPEDLAPLERNIAKHRERLAELENMNTSSGESGAGGAPTGPLMMSNGKEVIRVPAHLRDEAIRRGYTEMQ